jgi:aspartyl-tRNA(Asn)/glutamyl-tRNA(Gln) amidotransferase subunit A
VRIQRYDDRVRAWVTVDEDGARRAAEQLGWEAARGEFRGPLHGIPLGIKDIIDVAGLPTRAGSPLRENHVAQSDAPLVAALRKAGAIVLGKTVTVEFACFDPSPSRNPWDPELQHSPGGSSSGSAVAVAMGMCPGAIGTQTGGSLVRPSSYCGIATCKPTFGRVDTTGVVPVSFTLDHPGPMARSVADLEIMLGCMPPSPDYAPPRPVPTEPVGHDRGGRPLKPPRLGLVEEFFMDGAAAPVREAVTVAIDMLHRRGAEIYSVALADDFAEINRLHTLIMAAEAAAYHREAFAAHRQSYGPKIASLLDRGLAARAIDYAAALARLAEFRRRVRPMLNDVDALVMPATDTTAPPTLETTGNKDFQAPWSCSGLPVISLPSGLASDGMPVAVQLVGRDYDEASLFRVARWCETCFDFRAVPPLVAE